MKKYLFILLSLIIFTLTSCQKNQQVITSQNSENTFNSEEYFMVDLRGEVMYPGIYKVSSGTLVDEVIRLAGGVTNNADLSNINLVNIISSNTKIVVGSKSVDKSDETALININSCTKEELLKIPKIGESKANAIIDYRNKYGVFVRVEDLLKVNGIGDNLLEEIRPYITV